MKERKTGGGPPEKSFINHIADFSRSLPVTAGVLFIPAISLLMLALLVFLLSDSPARTLYFFFIGPFKNIFSFGNMINAATPLILGALGVTVAMKAGSLNLGGEGQIYLGAFAAAAAALSLDRFGVFGMLPAICAGVFFPAAMAAFSGYCRAKWNASELITTFLVSSAAIPVVNFLICGPFHDPQASLQSTRKIAEHMRFPVILKPSNISVCIFIAAAFVVVVHYFLTRTKTGYEIRMTGGNELFARYGGIDTKLNTVISMAISGGLYGLAGSLAVMGTYHAAIKEFSAGLGWNALAVALIASFSPPAIIPASLFFAWIGAGARSAMQNTGLTLETASIVQAVIFLLSTSLVIRNIFAKRGRK